MNGITRFWIIISVFLAFGVLFLALGCYVVGDFVLRYLGVYGGKSDLASLAQTVIAGVGGFVAGSMLIRKSIQWIREAKRRLSLNFSVLPLLQ